MNRIMTKCPACNGNLQMSVLSCPDCGLELKNDFELSPFDKLNFEQYSFLLDFLQARGNLKEIQLKNDYSYPTAKKKLDELLIALDLRDEDEPPKMERVIDLNMLTVDPASCKASELIKAKLKENGGHVTVYTIRGLPCEIDAEMDGKSFSSNKLPIKPPYEYDVFDAIVDMLLAHGGHAEKGNGRNYKFGEAKCDEHTVVGAVAKYSGHSIGDSVFDPVFVFAAILDWAGIAHNERGELVLTKEYMQKLEDKNK